jgi:pimeloyl-ACP methyl ester carboxylesterase
MVLIPNLVMDWTIFESFMERNSSKYTMYAVTLPGFAGSAPPSAPPEGSSLAAAPWMANVERAILRMIDEKGLDHPVLVGQSMGGHVALRLAIHNTGKFRGVVVINSMAATPLDPEPATPQERIRIVDEQIAAMARKASEEEWKAYQADWIVKSMPESDKGRVQALVDKAAMVPKAVSSRYMLEYFASDLTGAIGKVETPLLVIAPAGPVLNPRWGAMRERWKRQFGGAPKGTLVFFEDSGEFITEDSPAELDRAIEQFLAGQTVSGKTALPGIPPAPSPPARPPPGATGNTARPEPAPAPPKPAEPK